MYGEDIDFAEAWEACKLPWSVDKTPYMEFHIQEEFYFKNYKLSIPRCSLIHNLVKELHNGGLGGHFWHG